MNLEKWLGAFAGAVIASFELGMVFGMQAVGWFWIITGLAVIAYVVRQRPARPIQWEDE